MADAFEIATHCIFQQVAPRDALILRAVCRATSRMLGPREVAAAAFALSRHTGAHPLTLRTWVHTWEACAAAVEAGGHHAGAWAFPWHTRRHPFSGNQFDAIRLPPQYLDILLDCLGHLVAHELGQGHDESRVACILALNLETATIRCFLLLDDGNFAVVWVNIPLFVLYPDRGDISYWCMVSSNFPDACFWEVDGGGRLRMKPPRDDDDDCRLTKVSREEFFGGMLCDQRAEREPRLVLDGREYSYSEFIELWFLRKGDVHWKEARRADVKQHRLADILIRGRAACSSGDKIGQASLSADVRPPDPSTASRTGDVGGNVHVEHAVEVDGAFESEPVAMIAPPEAAAVVAERWATGVEWLTTRQSCTNGDALPRSEVNRRDILVLEFSRDPQSFDEVLLHTSLAHDMQAAGVDVQPSWANGAKIFVEGLRPDMLEEARLELKPRHVVVYEGDEAYVLSALDSLPSKARPRLKPSAPAAVVPGDRDPCLLQDASAPTPSSSSQSSEQPDPSSTPSAYPGDRGDGSSYVVVVRHTFVHVSIPDRSPRRSASV